MKISSHAVTRHLSFKYEFQSHAIRVSHTYSLRMINYILHYFIITIHRFKNVTCGYKLSNNNNDSQMLNVLQFAVNNTMMPL